MYHFPPLQVADPQHVDMAILAYGINYRTASLELREQLAFPLETQAEALRAIRADLPDVKEVAILSTCNRTELYCATDNTSTQAIGNWLANRRQLAVGKFDDHLYAHWEQDAARHVIRVAAGLDSQVLGEPQIMGQLKSAWELARETGAMGPELNLLSDVSLNVAKRIRTETNIGKNPVSVAFAAVSLARTIFADLSEVSALLVGAGETIELVAEHLISQGVGAIGIANRSVPNAQRLASRYSARALALTELATQLPNYDMIISSTGSALPVIGKGTVEAALRQRRQRPLFMVDIAVPRDIEPEVEALRDVYLYTIDDLTQIIEANNQQRRSAATGAEDIVAQGASDYLRKRRLRDAGSQLTELREQAQQIQQLELAKAIDHYKKQIANKPNADQALADAEASLALLARNLTNKLMHAPTKALRDASADGRSDLVDLLRAAYDLK